jgi:hypothetical protein
MESVFDSISATQSGSSLIWNGFTYVHVTTWVDDYRQGLDRMRRECAEMAKRSLRKIAQDIMWAAWEAWVSVLGDPLPSPAACPANHQSGRDPGPWRCRDPPGV